jgi:hypothetical protein
MWPTETEYGARKTNKMPFFLIKEHNPETLKRKITKFELNLLLQVQNTNLMDFERANLMLNPCKNTL